MDPLMTADQLAVGFHLKKEVTSEMARVGAVEKVNVSETGPHSNVISVWILPETRLSVCVAIYSGRSFQLSRFMSARWLMFTDVDICNFSHFN